MKVRQTLLPKLENCSTHYSITKHYKTGVYSVYSIFISTSETEPELPENNEIYLLGYP